MKEKMNWRALREYKCPKEDCGTPLRESKNHFHANSQSTHECPKCGYRIRDETLRRILERMRINYR